MPATFLRTLFSFGTCLLVVACASDSTGPVELDSETLFPVRYLSTIGPLGVVLPEFGIRGIGFGGPIIPVPPDPTPTAMRAALVARLSSLPGGAAAAMVFMSPSCLPDYTGLGTDADADGVPDNALITYTVANCTVYDSATGHAYLGRGTYRVRDTNDDRYGFQLDVTDLSAREIDEASHVFNDQRFNITETARTTATGGTYHLVLDSWFGTGEPTQWEGRRTRYDITQSFTPAGTIVAGGPLPEGTLTMSGTADYIISDLGPPVRLTLQLITTVPMVYDDGCGGFTSGAHEMRLNGSLSEGVHVVFTACEGHYEPIGAGVL